MHYPKIQENMESRCTKKILHLNHGIKRLRFHCQVQHNLKRIALLNKENLSTHWYYKNCISRAFHHIVSHNLKITGRTPRVPKCILIDIQISCIAGFKEKSTHYQHFRHKILRHMHSFLHPISKLCALELTAPHEYSVTLRAPSM